jgi:xanthine dehydrogenase accessory factor
MSVWPTIERFIAEHGAAVLVTLADAQGSSPREPGARMVVRPDGGFSGTIGGGALEWSALAEAQSMLARGEDFRRLNKALGPDLGQCCGGRVVVTLERFDARDRETIAALARAERAGPFVTLAQASTGRLQRQVAADLEIEQILDGRSGLSNSSRHSASPSPRLRGEGRGEGAFRPVQTRGDAPSPGAQTRADLSPRAGRGEAATYSKLRDGRVVERFGQDATPLYLFGAGHVGRALVLALAPLPFAVTWFDPRPGAFPPHIPGNVTCVNEAERAQALSRAPSGSFVAIMTHSHALDLDLAAAALKSQRFPYVGLIGSDTKRARFVSTLAKLGVAKSDIDRLICPIGLSDIQDKAPAAIAASIVAQLLIVRERGVARLAGNDHAPAPRTSSKHHA